MKIALLYYSGAGNTKFIAQNIFKKLQEKSCNVELLKITSKPIPELCYDFDLYIVGFLISVQKHLCLLMLLRSYQI